ncbi:MAG: DUF3105 domain-containing protein [Candidatus Sungbacteria bacterium]|uniref:DUF3105 domain-containing protein n=1 Tax=Candidatus Sungiibacteriota bacterium TaxID=2750080 RepID=A0A9D6DMU7_9BACT|nr:DUF3105 domain-containing protein [Candidatus Sungbacteria bacterium]
MMEEQLQESQTELSKKDRRELRRQEEENIRASFETSRKRKKLLKWIVSVLILAALVWGAYLWAKKSEADKPGEAVPIQPAEHIQPGQPIPGIYLSNPPVSGWHYGQTTEWGSYNEELIDQNVIHNLEHGGIWITYKPDVPSELVDNLKRLAGEYKRKIVLSPRSANDSPIVLAAWGRLDKFDYFDEARIKKFIKAYKDKGPEFVP